MNNTPDDMDDFLEACRLLGPIPETEEANQSLFAEMYPEGETFVATDSSETYFDDFQNTNYSVGSEPPHDTAENFGSPYETTQASSTVYCSSCTEFSAMKRWDYATFQFIYANPDRDIAEILSELRILRITLHHLSYDVSLVTEKLAERDEKDGKDERDERIKHIG